MMLFKLRIDFGVFTQGSTVFSILVPGGKNILQVYKLLTRVYACCVCVVNELRNVIYVTL